MKEHLLKNAKAYVAGLAVVALEAIQAGGVSTGDAKLDACLTALAGAALVWLVPNKTETYPAA